MLRFYGIICEGVKFYHKDFAQLQCPCIICLDGDFVLVVGHDKGVITYIKDSSRKCISIQDLSNLWSGHALLITSGLGAATEPNYKENREMEIQQTLIKALPFPSFLIIWFMCLLLHWEDIHEIMLYEIVLDWCGIVLCLLLVERHLSPKGGLGEKICTIAHVGDCDSVLYSEKAKIGLFTWSEIGLGYFVGRLIGLCEGFRIYYSLAIVGWIAMLYGIWSIWQQIFHFRKLCIFCISVQLVVWINGILYAIFIAKGLVFIPFSIKYTIMLSFLILLSIILIHIVVSYFFISQKNISIKQTLRLIKLDKDIFHLKMQKSKKCINQGCISNIIFGNRNSKYRITFVTNPLCKPCSYMHKRINSLLELHGKEISIEYVFVSFGEEYEDFNRFLVAAYQQLGSKEALRIYKECFEGRMQKEKVANQKRVKLSTKEVEKELSVHKYWQMANGLFSTPTLLVNGCILPDYYEIEDIAFL